MGANSIASNNYERTHEGLCQKFGQVQFVINQAKPQFQGILIPFEASSVQQTSQTWQKMIEMLSQEQEIKDLIVFPVQYGWNSHGNVCDYQKQGGRTYEVIYNCFFTTLASELKLRIEKKICFTEAQVWYIAYILLKVSSFFENHNWHLGNIHPKNVMIDKEGSVNIFTTFSSPLERQNIEQIKLSKYNDAYLAPQQISSLSSQQQEKNMNKNKIDAFYIGLIMLSLTCLKDLYFIFNHLKSSIRLQALGDLLLKLKQSKDKYSSPLYSMVENMLSQDPEQRNTPLDYFQVLKKYENDITQMNGINFQNADLSDFKFNYNKKYKQRRKHQAKQITFLALPKKYQESAFKTKQKSSKFVDQTNMKTNQKFFDRK